MANITKYLEKKLLEQSVGKITNFAINSETGVYVALFTSSPTANYSSTARDGVEVTSTATNYERKQILPTGWNAAQDNLDLTNSSKITNSVDITWPSSSTISGNWGNVSSIGIFDAQLSSGAPAGNLLWFGSLSSPVSLTNGDTFTIPSGNITLTLG